MRVMVIMKANADSEAGVMPSERMLTEMGNFNEELVNAGMMTAGEGLHPSSKGARVRFSAGQPTVTKGPFPNTSELVAGFWMWKVKSLEDALDWVKRIPNPENEDFEVEVRPVFETDDFGEELTPDARAQEDRLRARMEKDNS